MACALKGSRKMVDIEPLKEQPILESKDQVFEPNCPRNLSAPFDKHNNSDKTCSHSGLISQ